MTTIARWAARPAAQIARARRDSQRTLSRAERTAERERAATASPRPARERRSTLAARRSATFAYNPLQWRNPENGRWIDMPGGLFEKMSSIFDDLPDGFGDSPVRDLEAPIHDVSIHGEEFGDAINAGDRTAAADAVDKVSDDLDSIAESVDALYSDPDLSPEELAVVQGMDDLVGEARDPGGTIDVLRDPDNIDSLMEDAQAGGPSEAAGRAKARQIADEMPDRDDNDRDSAPASLEQRYLDDPEYRDAMEDAAAENGVANPEELPDEVWLDVANALDTMRPNLPPTNGQGRETIPEGLPTSAEDAARRRARQIADEMPERDDVSLPSDVTEGDDVSLPNEATRPGGGGDDVDRDSGILDQTPAKGNWVRVTDPVTKKPVIGRVKGSRKRGGRQGYLVDTGEYEPEIIYPDDDPNFGVLDRDKMRNDGFGWDSYGGGLQWGLTGPPTEEETDAMSQVEIDELRQHAAGRTVDALRREDDSDPEGTARTWEEWLRYLERTSDYEDGEPDRLSADETEALTASAAASTTERDPSFAPETDPYRDTSDPFSLTASATTKAPPVAPPAEWFSAPDLDGPTPLTVSDTGRVFGHLATWDTCHIANPSGEGVCVTPPRSASNYAYFHTGAITTANGQSLAVGHLTMDTMHASPTLAAAAAAGHYDNTGLAIADVRAGEDQFGIWVAGAMRPATTPEQVRTLRSSPLSGDWRRVGGNLELTAALAVNTPGFPIPRPSGLIASAFNPLGTNDENPLASLTAAGMLAPRKVPSPASPRAFSAEDYRYLKRLLENERRIERTTLAERAASAKATFEARMKAKADAEAAAANREKVAAFAAKRAAATSTMTTKTTTA